jgi:hypothetical protein
MNANPSSTSSTGILPAMFRILRTIVQLGPLLVLLAPAAQAKRPDLDTIFFGNLFHNGGAQLVPVSSGLIVVQAKLNGVLICEAPVPAGANGFVLKVPMDDGINPRVSGTARSGERVRVFVRNTSLNLTYEANQSLANGFSLPTGDRGIITVQDLTVTENLSGIAPMAMFASWAVERGLSGSAAAIAPLDKDGDGFSNYDEFLANSDPNSGTSIFRIMEVTRSGGNNLIKFGPIAPGRLYTIRSSETLGTSPWSSIGQVNPGTTADFFIFGHPAPAANRQFYRLDVTLAP